MTETPLAPSDVQAPRALDVMVQPGEVDVRSTGDGHACEKCCSRPALAVKFDAQQEMAAESAHAAEAGAESSADERSLALADSPQEAASGAAELAAVVDSQADAASDVASVDAAPIAAPPPAFAGFLHACRRKPPSVRATCAWTVAAALHLGALGFGMCHAFWHVEELAPTQVKVSLLAWSEARPVAPPPPPPPAGAATRSDRKTTEKTKPRPELVQPTTVETAPAEPAATDEPEAVAEVGGQAGGVEGGVAGGVLGAVLANVAATAPAGPAAPTLSTSERERLVARYLTDVLDRRLKAHLFYPPEAEEEELEGIVWLSVVIDDRGQLVSARVVKGADLGALPQAALQTVHRAQPFPPPPAALGSRVEVRVPLTYRLEG